jgi:hypothetical protein
VECPEVGAFRARVRALRQVLFTLIILKTNASRWAGVGLTFVAIVEFQSGATIRAMKVKERKALLTPQTKHFPSFRAIFHLHPSETAAPCVHSLIWTALCLHPPVEESFSEATQRQCLLPSYPTPHAGALIQICSMRIALLPVLRAEEVGVARAFGN